MKIITVLGTRPEIIRLSRIIPKLDKFCNHVLVHTGQNYDKTLSAVFMKDLGVRKPDYQLKVRGSFGEQAGTLFKEFEKILVKEKPDRLLVLGDTNSSLAGIVAKRMGIKVFHMEAGNRCFDDRVPEEVNRRLIDHSSDILLPYTERSRQNLLDEGIHSSRIYVTGNPIKEVIDHYTIHKNTKYKPYFLVTLHRSENVDNPKRLDTFVKALNKLKYPVVWPMHPHTRKNLKSKLGEHITVTPPVGFQEFISLQRNAFCVLTDSGTVQEECALMTTPVVIFRDSTERPETIEAGCNFVSGCEVKSILTGIKVVTEKRMEQAPSEYFVKNVSDTVVRIVLGYWHDSKDM